MATTTFEELQAAVIREKFIEAGVRSGRLEPFQTPYSRQDDGSLIVHVAEQRARIRLEPVDIHGPGAPAIPLVCTGRGRQWWATTVPIAWDATRTDWKPYYPTSTRDVAGELWNVVEAHARLDGWTLPTK